MTGPKSVSELIELLIQDVSDVDRPNSMANVDLDIEACNWFSEDLRKELPSGWPFTSPRKQLRSVLRNTAAMAMPATFGLLQILNGCASEMVIEGYLNETDPQRTGRVNPWMDFFLLPLVAKTFPQLIVTELASVQPMDGRDGKVLFFDRFTHINDDEERIQVAAVSIASSTGKTLFACWDNENASECLTLDTILDNVGCSSRAIALELNESHLRKTRKTFENRPLNWDTEGNITGDSLRSPFTHLICGPNAWVELSKRFVAGTNPHVRCPVPEQYAGLTLTPFYFKDHPEMKVYKTSFWTGEETTNKILAVRRGENWLDASIVWAPHYFSSGWGSPVTPEQHVERGFSFTHPHAYFEHSAPLQHSHSSGGVLTI